MVQEWSSLIRHVGPVGDVRDVAGKLVAAGAGGPGAAHCLPTGG